MTITLAAPPALAVVHRGFGYRRIPGRALERLQAAHPGPSASAVRAARARAEAAQVLRRPWADRAARARRGRS